MIGKKEPQDKLFVTVSLEKLVPKQDYYRGLLSILDLRFVYQECEKYYGKTGKPSIDPVIFFKIVLYGFFENITSDRKLIERINDSLSARYFVGYELDEPIPWHSTISRTRGLLGEEVFVGIFTKIVHLCVEKGLVEGKHLSIDSTLIKANASLDSLERKVPALTIAEYVEQTEPQEEEAPAREAEERDKDVTPLQHIDGENKKQKNIQFCNANYVSKTAADSKVATKPNALTNLYYKTHYTVEPSRVITDVLTTTADKDDASGLVTCLTRSQERLKQFNMKIESVGADRGYCTGENLRAVEAMDIIPFIPSKRYVNTTGKYDNSKFRYDSQKKVYICPNGKELSYRKSDDEKKTDIYLAKTSDCKVCPLKEECSISKGGRKICRSYFKEEYSRLSVRMKSESGKYAMKIRKTVTEPLFAEGKENHGLRKFMTRGLDKAKKNAYMIATVQNIKRIIKVLKKAENGQKSVVHEETTSFLERMAILIMHQAFSNFLIFAR